MRTIKIDKRTRVKTRSLSARAYSQLTSYTLGLIEFYNFIMRIKREILINLLLVLTVIKMLLLPVYFVLSFALNNITYGFKNYPSDDDTDVESQHPGKSSSSRVNIRHVRRKSTRKRNNSMLALSKEKLAAENDESEEIDAKKAAMNRVFAFNNLTPPFEIKQSGRDSEEKLKRMISFNYRLVRNELDCIDLGGERRFSNNKLNSDGK